MNAEIIAVGSELLLGQIDNSNATFISKELSKIGVNVYYHQVAGDNPERLQEAVKTAQNRADILIFTGGLGPTKDDLTRETLSSMTGIDLIYDDEAMKRLEEFFDKRGKKATSNNLKQALTFDGAEVLQNDEGLACGSIFEHQGTVFMLLPGPPREMKAMFKNYGIPYLSKNISDNQKMQSMILRFYEIGESQLVDKIDDLLEEQTNPTIAPLASDDEVTLRLTVKGPSPETNEEMLNELKEKVFERVGEYCYGESDQELEQTVADMLRDKEISVSAAESLTGGLFANTMTSFAGASMIFPGGVVCYSNDAKQASLNVPSDILENDGAVSEACAKSMAEGARKLFQSDYAISFTGAAGPDPLEGYQPGEMFIGLAGPEGTEAHFVRVGGSRNRIRTYAVKRGLYLLFQELRNEKDG
ncbi:competence/damage-inducible protein A [Alkalicoccus daliensis]|uniref:Putative competence-damage inducible protein n=1 Tax=Alkalicoccus daliensis TaxID=745820 RepID=A0A1H0A9Y3_9BACI|nr:competence/damage-inducible protein A [Alkalicoccus daliensis]SDN30081.1 nicotinamide-nucleotide amidase [Alkalicoccus daliensis]